MTGKGVIGGFGERGEDLSIVIPTYNCAALLAETLRSLQAQGDRIARAEIQVVDDCSSDEPEAVVRAVWGDRVAFHRHEQNLGATRNFNACLARAGRRWIHILHGDDWVLPGGYDALAAGIDASPGAAAVFGRTVYVDADGVWTGLTQRLGPHVHGPLAYKATMWGVCPVQFASVLVARPALDAVGGFDEAFTHAADYNLWWRLARRVRVAYTNACTGAYRHFPGNHSSTLVRTARDLREHLEQVRRVERSMQEDGTWSDEAQYALYAPLMVRALRRTRERLADGESYEAHDRILAELPLRPRSQLRRAELRMRRLAISVGAGEGRASDRRRPA